MNSTLRENKSHGSPHYSYSHYTITDVRRNFQVPIHWHEEVEIIYVCEGRLWVNVGGTVCSLTAGQVVLVSPRQLHLMRTDDLNVRYHTLLFPMEFISFQTTDDLEQSLFQPLRTGQCVLPVQVPAAVLTSENLGLLDRVIKINQDKTALYQLETRLLLLHFLMEVLLACPLRRVDSDEVDKLQREMLEYIRIHYREHITLTDVAKQFHLSPKYFSRYFREHFHLTFTAYLEHLRMDCARKLLETTDMSVTEVAEQCGFSGVSFFIRSFNRVNGCSPLKWRQFH